MEKNNQSLIELLGYYFIIFQTTFTGYVKCWIDGSEDFTYLTEDDFINLFEKIEASSKLYFTAKDAITTSSIYFWDIYNGTISRLTNSPEEKSKIEELLKIKENDEKQKLGKTREININNFCFN